MTARPIARRSIQKKLIVSSVLVLATALAGFLAAATWINASLASRQREDAFASIHKSLIDKGSILVSNNSQALREMVADNGFLAVANLVASTVRDDEDVVYGVYMDNRRQPWVLADSANQEGTIAAPGTLDDTASMWASGVLGVAHRRLLAGGSEVIEFVAPVRVEAKIVGVVRYGLATSRMSRALAEASRASKRALTSTIGALVLTGGLAALFAFFAARRQAMRITSDYEIGLLAADFDSMRRMVKEYTGRLEDMVAEKIQEIKDILDNIEPGHFTISMDGKINPDYALSTNMILDVEDVARSSLAEMFRLDTAQTADWMDWLEMVAKRHGTLRWEKLVRLCPVRELRLPEGVAGERIILVGYQKVFDRQKKLHKLMVLVQDVTDARRVERMIKDEKDRHDNEVKAILGIVRYPAFIPDFIADVEIRLRNVGGDVHRAPSAVEPARGQLMASISRELHTLKGTAATYGFESLSRLAREAEAALEELRRPGHPPVSDEWAGMARYLERMEKSLEEIRALVKSLSDAGTEAIVAVPDARIRELKILSASLDGGGQDTPEELLRLLRACRSIDHVRLDKLADKYRIMLQRVGERLGKRLDFRTAPEGLEISPSVFAALEQPLVHLLRNAADHGIEMEATRLLHGKPGAGHIQLLVMQTREGWEITVSDDGHGIDTASLARKALVKGLVEAEALAAMDEDDRRNLIFLPGLSSLDVSTEISGMGVGMDAVAVWAQSAGGALSVASQAGQGTRITLRLPKSLGGKT
ncbi:MAG: ATP-binding protein [Fibrobacterota bacterium]|nr:ATP-binding protein [Fibrobacterota bacterium]